MPERLKENYPELFFYACLFSGQLLFAGFKTSAITTLLLWMANSGVKSLAGKVLDEDATRSASLIVRSLLSLGLFPFAWLASRWLAGKHALPLLGLLLILGALFSLRKKSPHKAAHRRDYGETALALLLVVVLTWLPFSKIGFPIEGKYAFRAYFSSDYLKHFSVVEALNEGSLPPANPYFQGEALHYYWLPYAVPAVLARAAGSTAHALSAFSFTVNFLFLLMLMKLGGRICSRRKGFPVLPALLVLTPSLEGFYLWATRAHFSLKTYFQTGRSYNIDGLTRWLWGLPQIDTFLRALLYTPQHLLSLAFLVMFLYFFSLKKESPLALSLCLALSLAASFFVGGILFLSWGLYGIGREGIRFLKKRQSLKGLGIRLFQYFIPPLFVLSLSLVLKMVVFDGGGIFFKALSPGQTMVLLGLNLGFLVIGGSAGLLASRFSGRPFYSILLIVSLSLVLFVRIINFESDISLKAGLVIILLLALSTYRLAENRFGRKLIFPLALLIILPGLLTLILDIRNSADIRNRRFTSTISFEEMRMMEWVRVNIPDDRTVQNYPPARTWNLSAIPAFSGRRMVVGDRMHGQIFQVDAVAYEQRIEALGRAMAKLPASRKELRAMGVDYLLWGEDETRYFNYTPDLPVAKRIGGTILFSVGSDTVRTP